jgi:Raf kinase inhibitor-like YbhB/YbcL family protein
MNISSSSFKDGGGIPPKHARRPFPVGYNLSPQLIISGVPAGTTSLAICFVDRYPPARNWVHWLAVNIPPGATSIAEGASGSAMPAGSIELVNTFGKKGYGGPQPPAGSGVHPYELAVYALSDAPGFAVARIQRGRISRTDRNKVLAKAKITGGFEYK